jgi:ligand-binding sensor domain-containing protein
VVVIEHVSKVTPKGSRKSVVKTAIEKKELVARVNDLELDSGRWLAATTGGIYTSTDQGKTWKGGQVLGQTDFVSVQADDSIVVAATRSSVLVSKDSGKIWMQAPLPKYVVGIRNVAIASDSQIMVAAREGAFRSADAGSTWQQAVNGLPVKDITSVSFDAAHRRLLATSDATGVIFESRDGGLSWQRGPDSGYPLRRVSIIGGRFVGATPFDGVILQPENESISAAAGMGNSQ